MNRWRYVGVLVVSTMIVDVIIYILCDLDTLVAILTIESPAIELLGVIIAAVPELPYIRGYTSAVRTVDRIDNAVDKLASRGTEIDENISGFHYVASELVDQTGIEYPTTIRSTPIATKYWIDNRHTESFNVSSLVQETQRLKQRSTEWFQSLGLIVIAVGFAVQLVSSVLTILL